jgi:hypothetical protein
MVYVFGDIENNVCKIGCSGRPFRRFETIQANYPGKLQILSIMEGSFLEEKLLHSKYSEYRLNGEWFILDKIKEVDVSKLYTKVKFLDNILVVDPEDNFFNLSIVISITNKERIKEGLSSLNLVKWMESNKEFLDSFKESPVKYKSCYWGHPFVAIDILRNSTPKFKMNLYENLHTFEKFLVKENI